MIFPPSLCGKADARVSKAQNPADFVTLDHPSAMIACWNCSDIQEISELELLDSTNLLANKRVESEGQSRQ